MRARSVKERSWLACSVVISQRSGLGRNNYVVTADGQRFFVNNIVEENASQPITLVLNWAAEFTKNRLLTQ